jgi:acyl-CoA thioester hydrolase
MSDFIHKINYYETDKMGITHHSNYIRFMEEARMDFLAQVGYKMQKLEAEGITSPVVSIECQYKHPTTFGDEIKINVKVEKYTGATLTLSYIMTNTETKDVVLTAKSSHCFIDSSRRPIAVKKHFPDFDAVLKNELAESFSASI